MSITDTDIERPESLTPRPLDQKILGGIALYGASTEENLKLVESRILQVFDELTTDDTGEYGACIAYGIGLSDEDVEKVDKTVDRTVSEVGDNSLFYGDSTSLFKIVGTVNDKAFRILKNPAQIPMDDSKVLPGLVYSISARKR